MYFLSFFYDTNKNISKIINSNKPLLLDQCDLSKEVKNLEIFRELLIDNESIVVPQVYSEFTEFSNRVMVMEYLDGTPAVFVDSDILKKYSDIVIGYIVVSYVSSNPIHADLHPGNVLLLKDGRVGIIDFGITVEMTTFHANNMLKVFLAISNSNFNLLVDSLTNSFANKTDSDIEKDKIRNIIEVSLDEIKDDMFQKTNRLNATNFVKAIRQIIINVQDCNIDPKSLQVILSFVSSIYTIDKFSVGGPLSNTFEFFMGLIY
jgi:predicted unusual protein kinase regulating ubiquinone biosynthesis (AarF/ABC1/UbiB family)